MTHARRRRGPRGIAVASHDCGRRDARPRRRAILDLQSALGMAAEPATPETRSRTITFAVRGREAGRLHRSQSRPRRSRRRNGERAEGDAVSSPTFAARCPRSRPRVVERDLLEPMIQRSDNAAASRMVGLVGEAGSTRSRRPPAWSTFGCIGRSGASPEVTPPRGQSALLPHDRPPRAGETPRRYAMHLPRDRRPSRPGAGVSDAFRTAAGTLYFKGGRGSGTGLVDHQVALYRAGAASASRSLPSRRFRSAEPRAAGRRRCAAFRHSPPPRRSPAPGGRLPRAGRAARSRRSSAVTARARLRRS